MQAGRDKGSGFSLDILFMLYRRTGGELEPDVFIVRLPSGNANEAPAYLNFGGWDDCPHAAAQVAIANHWGRKWGRGSSQ